MSEEDKIISYMNKFQKLALYDYLQYYKGINASIDDSDSNVELARYDLTEFYINYTYGKKTKEICISFQPALENLGEVRGRFVAMARKAAEAFHVSPTRIDHYVCPSTASELINFSVIGIMMTILTAITLGIWPYNKNLLTEKVILWIKRLTIPTLAIHVAELAFTVTPLLRTYRAPLRVWLIYSFLTVLVGFPSWMPLKRKISGIEAYHNKFSGK